MWNQRVLLKPPPQGLFSRGGLQGQFLQSELRVFLPPFAGRQRARWPVASCSVVEEPVESLLTVGTLAAQEPVEDNL